MTNESTIVLAFDPGKTTGYAVLAGKPKEVHLMEWGEIDHWREADRLLRYSTHCVVIENYRLFPHMAQVMINQTIIGAEVKGGLIALLERTGIEILIQEPSERLHGARRVDVPSFILKGLSDHEKSAFHHALTFLVKRHFTPGELDELNWHRQEG